jgi:hypothetical protein
VNIHPFSFWDSTQGVTLWHTQTRLGYPDGGDEMRGKEYYLGESNSEDYVHEAIREEPLIH